MRWNRLVSALYKLCGFPHTHYLIHRVTIEFKLNKTWIGMLSLLWRTPFRKNIYIFNYRSWNMDALHAIRPKAIRHVNFHYQPKLKPLQMSFTDMKDLLHVRHKNEVSWKLTSSRAPTVFRQAFIVDMKFEVVGDETSSLASFRKLLTVILSGITASFSRISLQRSHLADICEMLMSTRRNGSKVSGELPSAQVLTEWHTYTSQPKPETKLFRGTIR